MEFRQVDIVGRFYLASPSDVMVMTGFDDHSSFCICARIVAPAAATSVCDSLKQHSSPLTFRAV